MQFCLKIFREPTTHKVHESSAYRLLEIAAFSQAWVVAIVKLSADTELQHVLSKLSSPVRQVSEFVAFSSICIIISQAMAWHSRWNNLWQSSSSIAEDIDVVAAFFRLSSKENKTS